ncbi:uncharacterized protein MELLADRAFT_102524 [Melampsora larici-populina 98AG31]|uniref:Transcription factor TFIIIC triple barrel domain-containing protein n=1 Tax=Melampsora larici-populina (strain 98AG31 / pathotype 3-4-7) TaxID=747676 RepID=F4R720_MELLP|nr:uncharacterized protein MELLADRAFT_102524 [Melampsora larici-populina 98AG31]EGG11583.1 hypothetical protein MELLADRAFT_102524 [Melampsora larici-populina 98AG31]
MQNSTKFPPPPPIDSTYKLVEEFPTEDQEDEWEEWEEEIEYTTLDLGSSLDRKTFSPDSYFQLLSLHSPNPILKIGNQFFKGTHEHLIGTELIMKNTTKCETKPSYDPLISLTSRVRFTPIDIQPTSESNQDLNQEELQAISMRHWASRKMTNTIVRRPRKNKSTKHTDQLIVAEEEVGVQGDGSKTDHLDQPSLNDTVDNINPKT